MQLVKNRPVATYFLLAYAVSWTLWLPRIASTQDWWSVELPPWWHYLGAAGPLVAALTVSAINDGKPGIAVLVAQYSLRRVRVRWLALGVLSPVILGLAALPVARLLTGDWPTYDQLSRADDLPELVFPVTLIIHTLAFGVDEETGWRGFALPRLQRNHTAIGATHLLALGWGIWHVPAFFENPSNMDMSWFQAIGFLAGLWMGAIFLTWLYNSAQRSLIVIVLWHGLFNQLSASQASGVVAAILSAGVILIAWIAVRLAGPEELTGFSPQDGTRQTYRPPIVPARRVVTE